MGPADTAKAKGFISAGTPPTSRAYRRGARKHRPFCRGAISGKDPSAGFTVPRRLGRAQGGAGALPQMRLVPCAWSPALTVIAENPSLHRGNTRWRDIIQAVTLEA